MEIIQHVDTPKELVRLIKTHYSTLPVIEKVLIIGDDPTKLLKGKMGVFVPETHTVVIAMRACMADQQWMEKGMTFIANVWCNLIYTILHEGAHARQLMEGEIEWNEATWDLQLEILDHAAEIEATEQMIDWFSKNPNIPSLRNLGWVGEQIKVLFNTQYSKAPDLINQELEVWGAGMLAEVASQIPNLKGDIEILENVPQSYKDTPEAERLSEAIDTGNVGMVINGRRCLSVGESLELYANHRS